MDFKLISAWDLRTPVSISPFAMIWLLVAAFLVFIMVPSIGFLEAGLTRRKNAIHGLMKSLAAVGIMSAVWTIVGFSLAFSPDTLGGLIGNPLRFLFGQPMDTAWPVSLDASGAPAAGVPLFVFMIFQTMFAAVTLALIGAGVPERMRFSAWLLFSLFFSLIVYPLVAHWVWSPNGILATLGTVTGLLPGMGVRDFAGGVVVHVQAGFAGLAVTLALGASIKREIQVTAREAGITEIAPPSPEALAATQAAANGNKKKTTRHGGLPLSVLARELGEPYGSSIPLAVIGTALLWFGWFGFNPGSSLDVNMQTAAAAVATNLAAALGGTVALLLAKFLDGKYDPIMAISGILGGLVMITPNAGFVDPFGAAVLGILAGAVTFAAVKLMDRYLYHVDDPIGGFPVHGVNGAIGSLAVPLFANPALASISGITTPGLFYGGGAAALVWLLLQAIGVVVSIVFVTAACWAFVKVVAFVTEPRASIQEELVGLDTADHGVAAEVPATAPAPAAG